ncbi:MAG: dTDP-4-dehydrorhamnose 3,5-epimerase [Nanoarchaeota archaeon]|mgnify:FL=1
MEIKKTPFEGLVEILPDVFTDARGTFFENYNYEKLKSMHIPLKFPLEFQSRSKKGVIRGLHFQKYPSAQGKLVRVIRGKALDVTVDIREHSPTNGKWFSTILSGENNKMLWIPAGFAHGFLALEDDTIMHYKATSPYNKESEGGIIWNDSELAIIWGIKNPILSERDKKHPLFKEIGALF